MRPAEGSEAADCGREGEHGVDADEAELCSPRGLGGNNKRQKSDVAVGLVYVSPPATQRKLTLLELHAESEKYQEVARWRRLEVAALLEPAHPGVAGSSAGGSKEGSGLLGSVLHNRVAKPKGARLT